MSGDSIVYYFVICCNDGYTSQHDAECNGKKESGFMLAISINHSARIFRILLCNLFFHLSPSFFQRSYANGFIEFSWKFAPTEKRTHFFLSIDWATHCRSGGTDARNAPFQTETEFYLHKTICFEMFNLTIYLVAIVRLRLFQYSVINYT